MPIDRDLLITTSVIDSINWFHKCPPSWKERAYESLSNTLNRKEWTPTPEIERGINFENLVYQYAKSGSSPEKCSPEFQSFIDACSGGEIQKKGKLIEEIDGQSYCLYTKMDVAFFKEKPRRILDIKTTKEYSPRKYREAFQGPFYCYVNRAPRFRYMVAVFNPDDIEDKKIHAVQTVDLEYTEEAMAGLRDQVHSTIRDAMQTIWDDPDLKKAYLEKYCLY